MEKDDETNRTQRGENEEGAKAGEDDTQATQSTAARKEAPWKEELVEGPSHLVREDVTSDLLPSYPPAWPSPLLRVTGLGSSILEGSRAGPPAKGR